MINDGRIFALLGANHPYGAFYPSNVFIESSEAAVNLRYFRVDEPNNAAHKKCSQLKPRWPILSNLSVF
jgi:hypothetical protein